MQIACNLEIFMCVIDVLTQCLKTPFSAEPKLQYTHAPASVSNTSGKHVHAIFAPLNPTFIIMQNWRMHGYIRKTSPCKVYPLKPHFYIVKLGYAGVYLFFLFLLQNIDCGYSLEPPRRGGSNVYPQSTF